ncbi:cubilin-like isoform X2 [Haliotis asinina]|uniref:cubilin-like isoform X2 n=1 Tax=Haliotis asinina TaxID=109174 RepID=UPI0035323A82
MGVTLHESSRRRQDAVMNIPCFVGICVLLYGPLVSGACNITLHAQREPLNFTSPNYPQHYGNNENCYWDIYPETSGYRVVLEMVYSNIEYTSTCVYDVLTIYAIHNGNKSIATSHRTCGISRRIILTQEDQHFHAVFKTDSTDTRSGFLIRYYEKNGTGICGVDLVATSVGKTFMSPGYPNSYFQSQTCIWTITTEHQNQTIQLDTMDSVIQNASSHEPCDTDNVTVYDGQYGQYSSYQLGTFCGNQRPVFNSAEDSLSVRLQTDSSRNYKGFKMLYKAIPATCNFTLAADFSPVMIVSPGCPNNYTNELDCQWTINAPIGRNITVKILFLDFENGSSCIDDYLLFKDGTTADARQLAKICEQTYTPIVSSSNHMAIIFHSDSSVTGGGFRLQYTSASPCGLTELSASSIESNVLMSPGYPGYDNNVNCEWKLRAPAGYEIKVEIISLSLEFSPRCSRDYLLIRDGSWFYTPRMGKYCGVVNYVKHISSRNHMNISFHTDGAKTGDGFYLRYIAGNFHKTFTGRSSVCGSSLLSVRKDSWEYLSYPGYPDPHYDNNVSCEWTISAPFGYKVKVKVLTISLEYDSSCSKDYVLFRAGSTSYATYCGDVPGYIVSSSNVMTITFRTDSSVTDKGFSLKYTAVTKGCFKHETLRYKTKYIESPNYPLSYPDNTDCEWTISTSIEGYVIHVEVVYFNIEYDSTCSCDYVELFNGTSSMGRWCGRDGPNIQITGQTLKVQFHSDGSTSLRGFKLSVTAAEPASEPESFWLLGALLGGIFGGVAAMFITIYCCCAEKSSPNTQQQRNRSTPTAPTDYRPYREIILLSDIQSVVTSSTNGASEYQGIDNPVGPS